MSRLVFAYILLGQQSRLHEWTRAFRNRSSHVDAKYLLTGLAVLTAIVLGMWVLSHVLARQERRTGRDSSLLLFLSLCRAHGLTWSQRWLLWRVARLHRLRDAARLFIEPSRLADENLSPSLRLKQAEIRLLRERLYRPAPEEPSQGGPEAPAGAATRGPGQAAAGGPTAFPIAPAPSLDIPPWNSTPGAEAK